MGQRARRPALRLAGLLIATGGMLLPPRGIGSAASADGPGKAVHFPPAAPVSAEDRAAATGASPVYHYGVDLLCDDCHVARAASADSPGDSAGPARGAGAAIMLRSADLTRLCLDCHDGRTGIPDVVGEDINGLGERSGGSFAGPDEPNPRGHDLGARDHGAGSAGGAACGGCHGEGGGPASGVTCVDCHDPHGNGNPRNLRWASNGDGTPPLGLFNRQGTSGLEKYERENVAYGTLNSDRMREASSLCLDCHHEFSGLANTDPDRDGIHSRHPTYDSEHGGANAIDQGSRRGSTDPRHWSAGRGTGFDGAKRVPFVTSGATSFEDASRVDPTANGVFCLSCHKAHGSHSAFGLAWTQEGPIDRRGCDQCHAVAPQPDDGARAGLAGLLTGSR